MGDALALMEVALFFPSPLFGFLPSEWVSGSSMRTLLLVVLLFGWDTCFLAEFLVFLGLWSFLGIPGGNFFAIILPCFALDPFSLDFKLWSCSLLLRLTLEFGIYAVAPVSLFSAGSVFSMEAIVAKVYYQYQYPGYLDILRTVQDTL